MLSKTNKKIKKYFTMVLKGHISVVLSNLNKYKNGKSLDYLARKYLKKIGVNFKHGTGHGVGFFSNVHEGPQSISKYNKINLHEGMILSNEPGYYKENFYGIRIENLIYVKKVKKKITFRNLTLAPIDRDLIDFTLLSKKEKDYLFDYHLLVYSKISKFLNSTEKKWLIKSSLESIISISFFDLLSLYLDFFASFNFLFVGFSPVIKKSNLLFTLLIILPEFFSTKDFASALLMPCNFPVNIKVLLLSLPLRLFNLSGEIIINFLSSSKTNKFFLFEKNFLIEFIWVSPIPSILSRSLKFVLFLKLKKFSGFFIFLANIFAFS